jgi:hypothetical protein
MTSLLMVLLIGSAQAASSVWVIAHGEAEIVNGQSAQARDQAVKRALRLCIEKQIGLEIQSKFSSQQASLRKNNTEQFYQRVEDQLTTQSNGFVDTWEVIHEETTGKIVRVKVKAKVFASKLLAEADKFMKLLSQASNKTVWVMVQEIYSGEQNGKTQPSKNLSQPLEKRLNTLGFQVKPLPAQALSTMRKSSVQFKNWLAGRAQRMAQQQNIGYLISGDVLINSKGIVQNAPFRALNGQTMVVIESSLQAIKIANTQVIASEHSRHKEYGSDLDRAVFRAFNGKGKNILMKTYSGLFESMKLDLERGQK